MASQMHFHSHKDWGCHESSVYCLFQGSPGCRSFIHIRRLIQSIWCRPWGHDVKHFENGKSPYPCIIFFHLLALKWKRYQQQYDENHTHFLHLCFSWKNPQIRPLQFWLIVPVLFHSLWASSVGKYILQSGISVHSFTHLFVSHCASIVISPRSLVFLFKSAVAQHILALPLSSTSALHIMLGGRFVWARRLLLLLSGSQYSWILHKAWRPSLLLWTEIKNTLKAHHPYNRTVYLALHWHSVS